MNDAPSLQLFLMSRPGHMNEERAKSREGFVVCPHYELDEPVKVEVSWLRTKLADKDGATSSEKKVVKTTYAIFDVWPKNFFGRHVGGAPSEYGKPFWAVSEWKVVA